MRKSVKEKELVKEVAPKIEGKCHHFWVIDVANGPSSLGKCRVCGEKREFLNAFPTFNPLRKNANPLALPRIPKVEMDKETEC
jgi:hypothetical protein